MLDAYPQQGYKWRIAFPNYSHLRWIVRRCCSLITSGTFTTNNPVPNSINSKVKSTWVTVGGNIWLPFYLYSKSVKCGALIQQHKSHIFNSLSGNFSRYWTDSEWKHGYWKYQCTEWFAKPEDMTNSGTQCKWKSFSYI